MLDITKKEDCCGCNACGDVCPYRAISFKTDEEGFWYPEIDGEKCVDCGLCEKICPIIHADTLKKNDLKESVCYAAEHKNLEVVFDSTSGGAFSALADVMYKNGGNVGGAVFNEDFSVRHYISNQKEDLTALRSSKYLQSNLSGFYNTVKGLLDHHEKVLVCGCPCQMAGLRAFLRKDYENLVIADFICRGINSPKVWRKYLDSFEERYGSPVVYAKAKSKEFGWRNLTQKVTLENGKSYYETKNKSLFTIGYLRTNVFCRPSCYDCKFKGFPRVADITLADYWGIEKTDRSMEKDLGISLVMINSKKGERYFEKVKGRINCFQTPFESILQGNHALVKSIDKPKINRDTFFEDLGKMSFTTLSAKYFEDDRNYLFRQKIKRHIKNGLKIIRTTKFHLKPIWQFLKINGKYNRGIFKSTLNGKYFLPSTHCILNISPEAKIVQNGIFCLGQKKVKGSKLESRLLLENGAALIVEDKIDIMCGADIEVFSGASLIFKGGGGANINCTIICGERIEIGNGVMMGRNVTIRDTNGGHYINRAGYRNTRPVVIGDKAWLCEGCTIMPGVKIGEGAIVGAHAFVTGNVPAYSMVVGNPARVVDEDVLWKY